MEMVSKILKNLFIFTAGSLPVNVGATCSQKMLDQSILRGIARQRVGPERKGEEADGKQDPRRNQKRLKNIVCRG